MLITDSYKELNRLLHDVSPEYGTSGKRYAKFVQKMVEEYETADILDYGCGKRTMETALGFPISNYDPCIPGLDQKPDPHDIVACTDVLEHIEPDCLDEVLADIRRCTRKAAFLLIATRPAHKVLADGRNAHLIQQPRGWWEASLLESGFTVKGYSEAQGGFALVCE